MASDIIGGMNYEEYNFPGQYIEDLLAARGWQQKVLAFILNIDVTGINKIIAGKKPVTAEMAIVLGEVFNIPPEHFLDLEKKYSLARARLITRSDPGRATRAHLFGGLPVSEMINRGWLEVKDSKSVPEIETALAKFFNVSSVDDIEILPHAAKKTDTFTEITPVQMAWVYRVRQIANEMLVNLFSPSSVRAAIPRLSNLLASAEEIRKVPRILAECGIRFVIVEALSASKIDGVCFWLDTKSPVIGMSLRYDRIDNFWFVLRHEIQHVLEGHGRKKVYMVDTELEGERAGTGANIAEEERKANEAAADFCVPQKKMEGFVARKSPLFLERDIMGFANTLKIHPGLIAGQLQHITGKFNYWRQHLVKVRHIIMPNTMHDGWGDVAPVD